MNNKYLSAFKAYDIRGIWQEQIDEIFAYTMGKAIGTYMQKQYGKHASLLIGSDVREANTTIIQYFQTGLIETGMTNIIHATLYDHVDKEKYPYGVCSTAALYYIGQDDFALSVSITASHNPPAYVGMKFFDKNTSFLPSTLLQELFINTYDGKISLPTILHTDTYTNDIITTKTQDLHQLLAAKFTALSKYHKFAVDFSNGAGVTFEQSFFTDHIEDSHRVHLVNNTPDGNFSAHLSETTDPENYHDVQNIVKDENCEFGIMFDGDADRIGFVDETGEMINGDIIAAIIAKQLLVEKAGSDTTINTDINTNTVIYETMTSKILSETVEKYNGMPVLTKVGRFFIREAFDEHHALFGGEVSGHYLFSECGGAELPLLALYYVMKELENYPTCSAMVAAYTKYYKGSVISIQVTHKEKTLQAVADAFDDEEKRYVDGVSIYGTNFWFNMRKSNSEDKIRFVVEADDKQTHDQIVGRITDIIHNT